MDLLQRYSFGFLVEMYLIAKHYTLEDMNTVIKVPSSFVYDNVTKEEQKVIEYLDKANFSKSNLKIKTSNGDKIEKAIKSYYLINKKSREK